jgi:peroxiredoxin family protein
MAEKATIVLQSGDFDKVYSALIIANGALAMGHGGVHLLHVLGLQRLKKGQLDKGPSPRCTFPSRNDDSAA